MPPGSPAILRPELRGPFDIVGDVHGCADELEDLLQALGWVPDRRGLPAHPDARTLVFVGDLVDRGPDVGGVLRRVMDLADAGRALCVTGNHEARLQRWLAGRSVRPTHGLPTTLEALADPVLRERVRVYLDGLPTHLVLDGGELVVAHAGMSEALMGKTSGHARRFALWGPTTGALDANGFPERLPWAQDYAGRAAVVYGHTPVRTATWLNRTLCLDTGCVFGGELTALRWPERALVSVPARRAYAPHPVFAPG